MQLINCNRYPAEQTLPNKMSKLLIKKLFFFCSRELQAWKQQRGFAINK